MEDGKRELAELLATRISIFRHLVSKLAHKLNQFFEGDYNGDKDGYEIPAGADVFLFVYNLHRSPYFWDKPNEFEPEWFLVPKESQGIEGWAGFDPSRSPGALYTQTRLYQTLPSCLLEGDQENVLVTSLHLWSQTISLAMLLQKFDVELKGSPESVELVTGATIHTKNETFLDLQGDMAQTRLIMKSLTNISPARTKETDTSSTSLESEAMNIAVQRKKTAAAWTLIYVILEHLDHSNPFLDSFSAFVWLRSL